MIEVKYMILDNLYQLSNIKIKPLSGMNFRQTAKGSAWYLNHFSTSQFVAIIDFVPGTGIRGNHYHKRKTEMLFVIRGELKCFLWLPDKPNLTKRLRLKEGDILKICPGLAHGFVAMEAAKVLELSPDKYDADDVHVSHGAVNTVEVCD